MTTENSFLGIGWSFPPTFHVKTKGVEMVKDEVDIRQSLQILLSTSLGERVMQPTFGCNMNDVMFEPFNSGIQTYLTDLVKTAILYHETRIKLDTVTVSQDRIIEGMILISLDYSVRTTNSRFNFVYPFYLKEGKDVFQK